MAELSEETKQVFFIPRVFAHATLVLSADAVFTYLVGNIYAIQSEVSLRWNDETIGINWPIDMKEVVTSDKDLNRAVAWDKAVLF